MSKSLAGISLILASLGLTAFAWSLDPQLALFASAGIALTSLSWTFLLATRSAFLEKCFHGIENMYFFHKVLAVFSILFLLFHQYTMGISGASFAGLIGEAAMMLFLSVVAVAYLGNRLKYEIWRMVHRFVFLAYLLGLWHTYLLSPVNLFSLSFLSLMVNGFALLGIWSGVYMIFLYRRIGFKHKGLIKNLTLVNADTLEIEIALEQPFSYEFGQFAFLAIDQPGLEKAPHPFSISGGSGRQVFFTIKSSGDYTRQLVEELKVGSPVSLDRAYGHMKLAEGKAKQVWIAGGIGITPFISFLRQVPHLDKKVDFYFAYTGEENAVYLDLLRDYAASNPNLSLHLVDSQVSGFLDFSQYPLDQETTVFMCGPLAMMTAFSKSFRQTNPKADLVYEGFSFK